MVRVPILRSGKPYTSVDHTTLVNHATGEPIAQVSQANAGLVGRDIRRMDDCILEGIPAAELLAVCRRAADLFSTASLPCGDGLQSFDDYVTQLSATTGMPVTYCRNNASKIHKVLAEMEMVLAGLTRGLDLAVLDRGWGRRDGRMLSFYREGRIFGAVLPSNSPGVHSLWAPAIALKAPVALKPGREEPWTPLRMLEAFAAAGLPREALGFYPSGHDAAGELLRATSRSMLFGDTSTTAAWADDPRVELHGPGYSKILLGDDAADEWPKYLDVIASSIEANAGRSCINASAVWTPRGGRQLAEALAAKLAERRALPASDPNATLAAFASADAAERINATIEHGLREGAVDLCQQERGSPRLVRGERTAWLLPTIVWCENREHPLANREFLFPYASVIECPVQEMPAAIGRSLVVTAISEDRAFQQALMASSNVDRLNLGAIPTWQLSWDQPHEGNLFEHLYRQRALQIETAA
jgi:acyl-CoA reductase-like NAD-dependent aldehyde dehydrogenase